MPRTRVFLLSLFVLSLPNTVGASYGFYVGKNLTDDGSVLIGGTGEEVSSHLVHHVSRFRRAGPLTARRPCETPDGRRQADDPDAARAPVAELAASVGPIRRRTRARRCARAVLEKRSTAALAGPLLRARITHTPLDLEKRGT
jgi:hypothetical protein